MAAPDSYTPQSKDRVARPSAAQAARRTMCLGSIDFRGVVEDRFQQGRSGFLGEFLVTMMEDRHDQQQRRPRRRGLMPLPESHSFTAVPA
jgi:hypothetical protein